MPYQPPPHGGQYPYPPGQLHGLHSPPFQQHRPRSPPPQQHHAFGPNAAYPSYPKPLVHPQVILPASPYAPQQHSPQLQQQQPVNQPPPNYAPRPIQARPPPPANNAPLHYGGVPHPQYYPAQSRTDTYPSLQQYSSQLPPRSQSQTQPHSYPPPHYMYPIIPPQPAPHQHRSVNAVHQRNTPVPKLQPKKSQSLKHMRSKSPVKMPQPQQHPAAPGKPAIDYHVLLLSLADEYIDAAHSQGTALAVAREETETDEYYKLIATGLACLEAVLKAKNWKLQPRTEALVRLRYARILYEETENDSEAEGALSKGVDLCERNRMYDLKYCMQQLLARILYKSNPKAAMKHVDGVIRDIEGYRHTAWEYAFRLLRVTLSLSSSSQQDTAAAIHNLQKVASLASRSGDKAVFVVSSVIEALVRLQHSSSHDSIEQAQRALATARSYQLDNKVLDIPQISTMIQIMDICCSLLEYDVKQSSEKLQIMQKVMDQRIDDPHWQNDGSFSVPLTHKTMSPSAVEPTDILQVENGNVLLTLRWLPEHDLYALCYFLSSVTLTAKNSQDGHKSEKYLSEGLKMIRSNFKSPQEIPESLASATARIEWRRALYCNMLLQLIFLACARTDWALARQTLKELQSTASELGDNIDEATRCLMEYASGIIYQGTGDLNAALATFQLPIFALNQSTSKSARNDPRRDTAILAALNSALILRDPSRPSHSHSAASKILSRVEPYCNVSPNKYIQAAYFLISATTHTESTIQTKHDLHHSLQAATAISNSQVTCIALTFMSWKYFRGVVGEQSEKSAKAARAMARKADDKLWISVTEDLLAATLDSQGKSGEARATREQADIALLGLPPVLKKMKWSSSSNSYNSNNQNGGGGGGGRSSSAMIMKAVEI